MKFSIGSDTEVFAKDKDGKHKALCGLIGGTKEYPKPITGTSGFYLQEDNVSLEWNIPYANNRTNFITNVAWIQDYSKSLLSSLGFDMSTDASVSFDKGELVHPNALVFGCEPDYDAWKMVENKKPSSTDATLRTAGGHIHVGAKVDMVKLIQHMDLFLGVPSVLLDDTPAAIKRRELYGKAGAMRPKPYGAEYRVLSNYWAFDTKLIGWVYDQTNRAVNFTGSLVKDKDLIIHTINTGDKDYARKIISDYGIILP